MSSMSQLLKDIDRLHAQAATQKVFSDTQGAFLREYHFPQDHSQARQPRACDVRIKLLGPPLATTEALLLVTLTRAGRWARTHCPIASRCSQSKHCVLALLCSARCCTIIVLMLEQCTAQLHHKLAVENLLLSMSNDTAAAL